MPTNPLETSPHRSRGRMGTEVRGRLVSALLATLGVLCMSRLAGAGHPLATDDAGTQGSGAVEVEVSGLAERPAERDRELKVGLGVALHAGLSQRIDLGVTTFWGVSNATGGERGSSMEDPSIDVKWRVLDREGARPGIALRGDYAAPQSVAGSNGHDAAVSLLVTWERDRFSSSVNVGLVGSDLEADGASWRGYAAAGGLVALAEGIHVGGELVAEIGESGSIAAQSTGALVWETMTNRVVSMGVGVTRIESARRGWLATLALTSAFGTD